MKGTRAAKRYAGALLGLASELKKVDRVAADMRLIHDSISASHELGGFFRTPIIDRFKKKDIITSLFKEKVDELTFRFALLLIDKGREALIDAIAIEFGNLLDNQLGIANALLKAPSPFDKDNELKVQSKLEDLTSKKIRITFSLDKDLVGGFLAQVGDTVYDGSIRRQLELLRRQLQSTGIETSE